MESLLKNAVFLSDVSDKVFNKFRMNNLNVKKLSETPSEGVRKCPKLKNLFRTPSDGKRALSEIKCLEMRFVRRVRRVRRFFATPSQKMEELN